MCEEGLVSGREGKEGEDEMLDGRREGGTGRATRGRTVDAACVQ